MTAKTKPPVLIGVCSRSFQPVGDEEQIGTREIAGIRGFKMVRCDCGAEVLLSPDYPVGTSLAFHFQPEEGQHDC